LPSKAEWEVLTEAIGGYDIAGKYLKSTSGWDSYNGESGNGDDKYDFSALPGGFGKSDGDFSIGETSLWWSASDTGIRIVDYKESVNLPPRFLNRRQHLFLFIFCNCCVNSVHTIL